MNIVIDGYNINYTDVGEGKPVVLFHGWGSSCDAYNFIIKSFSDRLRMVAVDFPGFGGSDMPKEPWNVSDYVDITVKFLDELGIKDPILIGHSFGGRVIIKMVGSGLCSPKKIVLIDAAGVKAQKSLLSKIKLASFKTAKWFLTIPVWKKQCEPALDRVRRHFGSADYNAAPPVLRQTLVKCINEDLVEYMPNIKAPTLLIWGENDTATPLRDAKIMNKNIPDSGLCVLNNVGHWAFVQRPYEVNAILNSFLGDEA